MNSLVTILNVMFKVDKKTGGALGGLHLTWRPLTHLMRFVFNKFKKETYKTTNSFPYRQHPLQSLHTHAKLVNNSAVITCTILSFFSIELRPDAKLGKQIKTLIWCYVASHWQWWVGCWQVLKNRVNHSLLAALFSPSGIAGMMAGGWGVLFFPSRLSFLDF